MTVFVMSICAGGGAVSPDQFRLFNEPFLADVLYFSKCIVFLSSNLKRFFIVTFFREGIKYTKFVWRKRNHTEHKYLKAVKRMKHAISSVQYLSEL